MSHDQDHDHAHVHRFPPRPDQDDTLTYYCAMATAVRELLIDKGVITADDVRRQVEDMHRRDTGLGANMVARAWLDLAYKQRILPNGSQAAKEFILDVLPLISVLVATT